MPNEEEKLNEVSKNAPVDHESGLEPRGCTTEDSAVTQVVNDIQNEIAESERVGVNDPPQIEAQLTDQAEPSETIAGTENKLPNATCVASAPPATPQNSSASDEVLDAYVISENGDSRQEDTTQLDIRPTERSVNQMTNAMVGRPYDFQIELNRLEGTNIDLSLQSFADQVTPFGLSVSEQNGILRIEGTPNEEAKGDRTFVLDYTLGGDKQFRSTFTLLVNPDPKTLWKEIEPDENAPFKKPHTVSDRLVGNDFQILAASRRGRSHAQEGKFREDDYAVRIDPDNDWYYLVVSDGAGSAKLSREGSRLACHTAVEFLGFKVTELLEPKIDDFITANEANRPVIEKDIRGILYQVLAGAAFASYKKLEGQAETSGDPIKDYSCTLLIGIVKKHKGKNFLASFSIGDGAIAAYDARARSVQMLSTPDGGEYSGQTRFLTMKDVIGNASDMMSRIRYHLVDDFEASALFLMTDGISDPKFSTDNNLLDSFKWHDFSSDLLDHITLDADDADSQLLEWMNFWSQGEHDDRTLVILCPINKTGN